MDQPNCDLQDQDEYDSGVDEDFNPESAEADQVEEGSSSSDEDSIRAKKPRKGRAKHNEGHEQDRGFENSGDEATIQIGRRRKKRKRGAEEEDDDEGEGGLVKTRAQRLAEKGEKKSIPSMNKAFVDVNALWEQMAEPTSFGNPSLHHEDTTKENRDQSALSSSGAQERDHKDMGGQRNGTPRPQIGSPVESMVTIKRKIEFADQTTEEERQVPASSAEAKLYLQEQSQYGNNNTAPRAGLKRPTKRKSIFERQDLLQSNGASSTSVGGKKLTTLEKSKLDWAAHVDKEGIADELDEQSKGKNDYLGRVDFLGRMDAKRETG